MIARAIVALSVAGLGLASGGYGAEVRTGAGVAIWSALAVLVGFGVLGVPSPSRRTAVACAGFAGFAGLTLASAAWASSAEGVVAEFDRAVLYLGVLVVAVLCARSAAAASDGAAIGISAVGALALASRFFPGLASSEQVLRVLPSAGARLYYPVGYWNGLAILLALAIPLLLRAAVASRRNAVRAAAVAPIPALAGAILLTSSRGGAAVAVLGALAFVALAPRRAAAVGALVSALAGSAATVWILAARGALLNGPIGSTAAAAEGRSAALLVALACVASGVAYAVGSARLEVAWRVPRAAVAVTFVLLVGLAAAVAHPVRRFEAFKRLPPGLTQRHQDLVSAHLLSGGGSGRWQFWAAAFDEWRSAPLLGRGAGSYEAWWARHGSFPYFVRNAHSLYLEVLGELGVLGLGLLLAAFATGLVAAARRLRDDGDDRMTVAAVTACFVAFATGAAIDWVWQIPVVAIVGIGCLGLLVAGGSGAGRAARLVGRARAAVAAIAVALALAEAVPLLGTVELHASQRAFRHGDLAAARSDADAARRLQPWAASPYLQLALVDEDAGDYAAARRHIEQAIRRSDEDWRLWLVSARLATRAGAIRAALASLDRARELNPRSPLFASSREPG